MKEFKKESALDYFVNQINFIKHLTSEDGISEETARMMKYDYYNIAKKIERKQISDAYHQGGLDFQMAKEGINQEVPYYNEAEQYYNEHFEFKESTHNDTARSI